MRGARGGGNDSASSSRAGAPLRADWLEWLDLGTMAIRRFDDDAIEAARDAVEQEPYVLNRDSREQFPDADLDGHAEPIVARTGSNKAWRATGVEDSSRHAFEHPDHDDL